MSSGIAGDARVYDLYTVANTDARIFAEQGLSEPDAEERSAMESIQKHASLERARNATIAWLEQRGVSFGPHRKIEIGRLGLLTDHEVGVSATTKPYWRLRLDYDPDKGPHFNAEYGEGGRGPRWHSLSRGRKT